MIEATAEPTTVRARVAAFMETPRVQWFITAVIIVNAITLGLETSDFATRHAGGLLKVLDRLALGIFVVEISLKLFGNGLRFFSRTWNVFDFVIVGIALIPSSGALSVLRALRILRVLRLVSIVPAMRRVVAALLSAIPGVGSVIALMILVFYVFAVIATVL